MRFDRLVIHIQINDDSTFTVLGISREYYLANGLMVIYGYVHKPEDIEIIVEQKLLT